MQYLTNIKQENKIKMVGLISSICIGILAGYVASHIQKGKSSGCWINLFLGVLGSMLGSWLFSLLNIQWGGLVGEIGIAIVGAVIVLWIWSKLKS